MQSSASKPGKEPALPPGTPDKTRPSEGNHEEIKKKAFLLDTFIDSIDFGVATPESSGRSLYDKYKVFFPNRGRTKPDFT